MSGSPVCCDGTPASGGLLERFDGRTRLLVGALMCGASGARRARTVLRRQQRAKPPPALHRLVEILCGEEICPETEDNPLTVKPLLSLFPASFKQNLLSFIRLVPSALPRATVLQLLECLRQEARPDPWVAALLIQLERDLGAPVEKPLYTSLCGQRLTELCRGLVGLGGAGGWAKCFTGPQAASASQSGSEPGTQRKRKSSLVTPDSDTEETGQQSKRIKVDFSPVGGNCGTEGPTAEERGATEETSGGPGDVPTEASAEALKPAADSVCGALSEQIQVSISQIKELLQSQTEWDQSSSEAFKVLNECDSTQVEALCGELSLPDIPEQNLPKLCGGLLALSPDLSYSTATAIIRSLLLDKVLSLAEPASRCLVTAATSLCSRYPRPTCHALIAPVLQEKTTGNPQAELLNRLIEDCLEPHHRLLVLQMALRTAWSEALLSIIHSLLDSKPELSEELFGLLAEQLVAQAPHFTKSMKYAKMMLTVLTKYDAHVTAAHKHSLSGCLTLNETFLKKSLQAALKRITHT